MTKDKILSAVSILMTACILYLIGLFLIQSDQRIKDYSLHWTESTSIEVGEGL